MIVLAQIRAWRIRPTDPVVFSGSSSGGVHDANAVPGVPDPDPYPAGMLADAYVDYRTYGRMQMLAQDMQSFNAFLSYLKVMEVERVVVERLPLLPQGTLKVPTSRSSTTIWIDLPDAVLSHLKVQGLPLPTHSSTIVSTDPAF
jgi:hypothetical protein